MTNMYVILLFKLPIVDVWNERIEACANNCYFVLIIIIERLIRVETVKNIPKVIRLNTLFRYSTRAGGRAGWLQKRLVFH